MNTGNTIIMKFPLLKDNPSGRFCKYILIPWFFSVFQLNWEQPLSIEKPGHGLKETPFL
jgi:hypothetical protein